MSSFANNYDVVIENDDSGEKTTYSVYNSGNIEKYKKNKYIIIKIINRENNIIYEYKQVNSSPPLNEFIKIKNNTWWIGGKDYMTKLFFNCDTGEVYEDIKQNFIWSGPYKLSPDENYMLMDGCIWSFPYDTKLYYVGNLKNGYKEIDIHNNLKLPINNDDNELNDDFVYEFVSNNEINIYVYNNGSKTYYNTIIIPKLI